MNKWLPELELLSKGTTTGLKDEVSVCVSGPRLIITIASNLWEELGSPRYVQPLYGQGLLVLRPCEKTDRAARHVIARRLGARSPSIHVATLRRLVELRNGRLPAHIERYGYDMAIHAILDIEAYVEAKNREQSV